MRSTMGRRAYSSDLTDKQWEVLRPLIPLPSLEGRLATVKRRELVNAMLYVLRSGCPWRLLPHEFPAWGTVYYSFRRWQAEGVWEQILQTLRTRVRQQEGRNAEPSAAIIDSQSMRNQCGSRSRKGLRRGEKKSGGANGTCWLTPRATCWLSKCWGLMGPIRQGPKPCLSR
jgi:putative transposase